VQLTVDAIIPARDEERTVTASVQAALGCQYVREVVVIDDGSSDDTADRARAAGAKVVSLERSTGSKAHALAAGVARSDADAFLFLDADLVGITAAHLDAIVEPGFDGAALSIGAFDYGRLRNPFVLRCPPLSGQRLVSRAVWDAIPADKLDGYTIEVRINQVVAEHRLPAAVRTLARVHHRTKRNKHGVVNGLRRTWRMYRELASVVWPAGDVALRTHWWYLRHVTIARPAEGSPRRA
jgi:glycosyltransferase involved in cell wall biosynthesis